MLPSSRRTSVSGGSCLGHHLACSGFTCAAICLAPWAVRQMPENMQAVPRAFDGLVGLTNCCALREGR